MAELVTRQKYEIVHSLMALFMADVLVGFLSIFFLANVSSGDRNKFDDVGHDFVFGSVVIYFMSS